MKKLNVLDLFSGIGGFSLGLHNTGGFETIAFCEQDEICQKVLRKNFSKMIPIFNDVTKIKYKQHEKGKYIEYGELKNSRFFTGMNIDVICGGFPCQDISVAGLKKGLKGERSGLWFEFYRLIKEIKPKYVVIENVANLRNQGLGEILKSLGSLGYDCEWHILSACAIGAIHRRERLFIITNANSGAIWDIEQRTTKRRNNIQTEGKTELGNNGETGATSNANNFRFWPTFATPEEKQEWWTKTAAGFSDVFGQIFQVEPTICRSNDGLSKGLDKPRKQRIKQLGNAVVPQLIELIGYKILEKEGYYEREI